MELNLTELTLHFIVQLAFILLIAKLAGELTERYLKQPAVLGELCIGMVFGPYALGNLISIPHLGPLFPKPEGDVPIAISTELWVFAQVAVILLLFIAGLETDLKSFLRYGMKAFVVGVAGVALPFSLGVVATAFFSDHSMLSPVALFMGSAMTATSVGITARVLSDIKKLDTPEGVTILAAAVIDDVLGILILTIVLSMAPGEGADATTEATIDLGHLGIIALKSFGVWLGVTGLAIWAAKSIEKFFGMFRTPGARLSLALSLCFGVSALVEFFGLAMIIGAYSMGLALSQTKMGQELIEDLEGLYHAFVPVFFVVMGMLVSFPAMRKDLWFGVGLSLLAIVSKIGGCGGAARLMGFNNRGSYRIGVGMLPRGEVALIIAGMGLARGAIDAGLFGVVIMMTFVTTLLAPIMLIPAFKGGSGLLDTTKE